MSKKQADRLNVPAFKRWCAHVESLTDKGPEYKKNLRWHVLGFLNWLIQHLELSIEDDGKLSWTGADRGDPELALQQALFDPRELYVELYLLDRAEKSAHAGFIATLLCSLKRAYEFFANQLGCQIDPEAIVNPLTASENRHPLGEAWLKTCGLFGNSLATRRLHFAQYLRFICEQRGLHALNRTAWRKERMALLAIREAQSTDAWEKISEDERVQGTLSAELCFTPSHAEEFLRALAKEQGATSSSIRDRVYIVRKFYVWMVESGLSDIDLEKISNPLADSAGAERRERPKPKPKSKPGRAPKPASAPTPPAKSTTSETSPALQSGIDRTPMKKSVATLVFTMHRRLSPYRFRQEHLPGLLNERDDLITKLSQGLPANIGFAAISEANCGDFIPSERSLKLPRLGDNQLEVVILPGDLCDLILRYRHLVAQSPLGKLQKDWGDQTPLFQCLDGGRLFVDTNSDPNDYLPGFIQSRNVVLNRLMKGGTFSFRKVVDWKNRDFRAELTAFLKRNGENPQARELIKFIQQYDQWARLSGLQSAWTDPDSSFLLGADGGALTADEHK